MDGAACVDAPSPWGETGRKGGLATGRAGSAAGAWVRPLGHGNPTSVRGLAWRRGPCLGSCSSSLAPARSPPGEAGGEEQLKALPGCKQTEGLQHHGYPGHAPAAAAPWGVNHGNKKTANRRKGETKANARARGAGRFFFLPRIPRALEAGGPVVGSAETRPGAPTWCPAAGLDTGKARGKWSLVNPFLNV